MFMKKRWCDEEGRELFDLCGSGSWCGMAGAKLSCLALVKSGCGSAGNVWIGMNLGANEERRRAERLSKKILAKKAD